MQKPKPKPKRVKTTLYLPEVLWKTVKIMAIEANMDATDIVVEALRQFNLQQFLKKAGAR